MVTRPAPVIALDGPASSGKSSVGAAVAAALGFRFFDSGLLYRALAFAALDRGVDPADGPGVAGLAPGVSVEPDEDGRLDRVRLDGVEISARVRTPEVDRVVSAVARAPEVRAALLVRQRALAAGGGIVVAGRDIGTVVLPDADVKIWLDASVAERAARRAVERGIDPASAQGRAILDEMRRRDGADGARSIAPARPADDAIHVRTDGNTLEGTIAAVIAGVTAGLAGGTAADR
jgi:cytidylate kinase